MCIEVLHSQNKILLYGKVNLDDIKLDDDEVEIFGNRNDIQGIDEITAEVDLDGVTESTDRNVNFNLPEDVSKVNPKETTAKITIK